MYNVTSKGEYVIMIKHGIIPVILVGIIAGVTRADAAVKCAPLSDVTAKNSATTYNGSLDWTAVVHHNASNQDITVRGIGVCAASVGSRDYVTISSIITTNLGEADPAHENNYCWCKIISPAVSHWIYPPQYHTSDFWDSDLYECQTTCGYSCGVEAAELINAHNLVWRD